jgi:hypothetical protein
VFAFPLVMGAISVGALEIHRGREGELSAAELADGLLFADAALPRVLDHLSGSDAVDGPQLPSSGFEYRWAEVHQATGMISVQLASDLTVALLRWRATPTSPAAAYRRWPVMWSSAGYGLTQIPTTQVQRAPAAERPETEHNPMLDERITQTLVDLADTLVLGFDGIEFLHTLTERCVQLLDVDAAGILLIDSGAPSIW